MSEETLRAVDLTRLEKGRYEASNARGGRLVFGTGDDDTFTPVELLLASIAGCSAADIDFITSKRSEPTRFNVRMTGDKTRDDQGNRMTNLVVSFDVGFPDDEGGKAAMDVLPRAAQRSHDQLCTVSRTVEVGTPVTVRLTGLEA
jgi:putative redox protein